MVNIHTHNHVLAAGPVINTTTFSLLTELTVHPPVFTLTCTSTSSPPTSLQWRRNGNEVSNEVSNGDTYSAWQVLVNGLNSSYDSVLRVVGSQTGQYQCEVSNTRGSDVDSVMVQGECSVPCVSH